MHELWIQLTKNILLNKQVAKEIKLNILRKDISGLWKYKNIH